jgi:molecular chaperone DnaK (HSP70)
VPDDLLTGEVRESFLDRGVNPGDIDAVFLAGGTTLLPSVREGVARYFGAPAHLDFDPLEVVSAGASLVKS